MDSRDDSISVGEGDLGDQQQHAEWLGIQMKRITGNNDSEAPLLGVPEIVADSRDEGNGASRSVGNGYSKAFPEHHQAVTNPRVKSHDSSPLTGDAASNMPLLDHREAGENPSDERQGASQPRRVNRKVDKWKNFLVGIAMIGVSIPLVAFGIRAQNLSSAYQAWNITPEMWHSTQNISQKIATLFPIIYATVLGWCLKKFAGWKLERTGLSLNPLERIMNSQSVGSTLLTQLKMGIPTPFAILLLCLWSFSPLGSQASLKVLELRENVYTLPTDVTYFNTDADGGFSQNQTNNTAGLNVLFSSLLMSEYLLYQPISAISQPAGTEQVSGVDVFGNTLIPDISRSTYTDVNGGKWYNWTAEVDGNYFAQYGILTDACSSLLGNQFSDSEGFLLQFKDPTRNVKNITFSIETSYISLNCGKNITVGPPYNFTSIENPGVVEAALNGTLSNETFYGLLTNNSFSLAMNGFYRQEFGTVEGFLEDSYPYEPRTLLFQSHYNGRGSENATRMFCQLSTTYVESVIWCRSVNCIVTDSRHSLKVNPNPSLTALGFIGTFTAFSRSLQASSEVPMGTSSALECYIQGPAEVIKAGLQGATIEENTWHADLRLQQVLNAYLQGNYGPRFFISHEKIFNVNLSQTAGHGTVAETIYNATPWLAVYLFASFTMLATAITGFFFSMNTVGPEVLGYCSTLAKDSPYITESDTNSTVTGFQRTSCFKNLKLKLADVEPQQDVGYIAIVEENGPVSHVPLRTGRLYR